MHCNRFPVMSTTGKDICGKSKASKEYIRLYCKSRVPRLKYMKVFLYSLLILQCCMIKVSMYVCVTSINADITQVLYHIYVYVFESVPVVVIRNIHKIDMALRLQRSWENVVKGYEIIFVSNLRHHTLRENDM